MSTMMHFLTLLWRSTSRAVAYSPPPPIKTVSGLGCASMAGWTRLSWYTCSSAIADCVLPSRTRVLPKGPVSTICVCVCVCACEQPSHHTSVYTLITDGYLHFLELGCSVESDLVQLGTCSKLRCHLLNEPGSKQWHECAGWVGGSCANNNHLTRSHWSCAPLQRRFPRLLHQHHLLRHRFHCLLLLLMP